MKPDLGDLIKKYAAGELTKQEEGWLKERLQQLDIFQEILKDRKDWEEAMQELIRQKKSNE